MIWILIGIVAVVFMFFVFALNPDKIKSVISKPLNRKQKEEKVEKPKQKEPEFTYSEYEPVKVDNLGEANDNDVPYTTLAQENETERNEEEAKGNKVAKGGRKTGDVKAKDIEMVTVEDLGEYDENADSDIDPTLEQTFDEDEQNEDYDMFDFDQQQSIGEEIRNLSPELKVLLIDNVLNKKGDEDKK